MSGRGRQTHQRAATAVRSRPKVYPGGTANSPKQPQEGSPIAARYRLTPVNRANAVIPASQLRRGSSPLSSHSPSKVSNPITPTRTAVCDCEEEANTVSVPGLRPFKAAATSKTSPRATRT
jgi:hypothetical protein